MTIGALAARIAAVATFGAAVVHVRGVKVHTEEDPLYGAFFVAAAAIQAAVAIALVAARLPSTRRRSALAAGAVNVVVLATWAFTRVFGPPVGADAWLPERVAFADLVAAAIEFVAVVAAVVVLKRPSASLARASGAPAVGVALVMTVPLVALADPDTHSALCRAHADGPDVGPLAAAFGHSMLEPGRSQVVLGIGESKTVLVGKFINCDNHRVTVSGAKVLNAVGGVEVEEFRVGRLGGTTALQRLGHEGVEIPTTGDEANFGLFAIVRAISPGPFGIHAVAVDVGDHHRDTIEQPFATVVPGRVVGEHAGVRGAVPRHPAEPDDRCPRHGAQLAFGRRQREPDAELGAAIARGWRSTRWRPRPGVVGPTAMAD